ncbi:RDD family protein [Candidatus Woesearchaeota archaeon]|nr:MAG: RDD family protein [Candidatus Woesearchaeota archaeon]
MKVSMHEMTASLWKRALAFVIDLSIINLIVISPFRNAIGEIFTNASTFAETYEFLISNPDYLSRVYGVMISVSALAVMYFALLEWKTNQTIGKYVMRIHVKPKSLKLWQAVVRNLEIVPFFPFVILMFLDPVFLIFKNKRLSEILSKTETVEYHVWTP